MEKLTIILNDPPYGTEKIYNGLRYASALVSAGGQLNLFLLVDGVAVARRGQKTPTGYYNVADMLSELISKGVKVKTCWPSPLAVQHVPHGRRSDLPARQAGAACPRIHPAPKRALGTVAENRV